MKRSLFAELRRRNVIRAAVLYIPQRVRFDGNDDGQSVSATTRFAQHDRDTAWVC